MYFLDKLILISAIIFPISLIGTGVFTLNLKNKGRISSSEDVDDFKELFKNRVFKTFFLAFSFSTLFLFGGTTAFSEIMENKIKKGLRTFNSKTDKLFINNKQSQTPIEVINDLVKYYPLSSNHSAPTKSLKVKALLNAREINLSIARDSKDSTVYWVFIPDYIFSKNNKIWKIKTDLFNKYK